MHRPRLVSVRGGLRDALTGPPPPTPLVAMLKCNSIIRRADRRLSVSRLNLASRPEAPAVSPLYPNWGCSPNYVFVSTSTPTTERQGGVTLKNGLAGGA